jgi:arylsulfatase A-like enzyme
MKNRMIVGALIGAIIALVWWAAEWRLYLLRDFSWARAHGFRALEMGLTAYGAVLYLAVGSTLGAILGFVLLKSRRPGRLVCFLVPFLLGLPVFVRLLVLVNHYYLPELRSTTSIIGNVGYAVAALLLLLALYKWVAASVREPRGLALRVARRCFLVVWIATLGFGGFAIMMWNSSKPPVGQPRPDGARKPNVLLILIETTRADHIGCYGYKRDTTPNIDALASEGVVFENYYTAAPFSGPSKATLATGRFPYNNGVRSMPQRIRSNVTTLAEEFRANGYRTGGFASGLFMGPQYGYHRGFETYECLGIPYDLFRFTTALRGLELTLNRMTPWYMDADERVHVEDATRAVPRVLNWIDSAPADPFYCLLEFNEPHLDYIPPPPFDSRFTENYPEYTLMKDISTRKIPRYDVIYDFDKLGYSERDVAQSIALYDGEIAYVDWAIGNLVSGLRSRGLLDNTVVMVTADHGENFGEHGIYFQHTQLYEAALHVPMVVHYPPKLQPTRVKGLVQEVDVFPTLMELAGISHEAPLDGVSMLRKLDNDVSNYPIFAEDDIMRDPVLKKYPTYRVYLPGVAGKWRMVRDGDWKLIYIPKADGGEYELYNVVQDPLERNNRYATEAAIGERLRLRLDKWMEQDITGESDLDPALLKAREKELRALGYIQ